MTTATGQPAVFTTLNHHGPKIYVNVVTEQNVEAPKRIKSTAVFNRQIFNTKSEINAMPNLAILIQNEKYELLVKIEVLEKGFDIIETGLNKLIKGVSDSKYIMSL